MEAVQIYYWEPAMIVLHKKGDPASLISLKVGEVDLGQPQDIQQGQV